MANLAGDVCILFSESAPESERPAWQVDLQNRFGGMCTTPIHLTLQRIPADQSPDGAGVISATRQALCGLAPLWIAGTRLEAILSPFRESWIAKLRVAATPAIIAARRSVVASLESIGLSGAVPYLNPGETAPITVLELMDPPDSRWQHSGDVPCSSIPEPVGVNLDVITVSRIRAPFDYEMMASWRAGQDE